MKKLFAYAAYMLCLCLFLSSCQTPDKELPSAEYAQKINQKRQETDDWMRNNSESPILERENFEGLAYFAPNQDYIFRAKLELIDDGKIIELPTSIGKKRRFVRYATARFTHQDKPQEVTLLKAIDPPKEISLLFTDETSGNTTYEAGRYLEPEINGTFVWLDFNRAYQPYCAYNKTFDCPIPPKENHLSFEVKAGEKMP
jgi:uncharacterized protein (DUF1684 family)